MNKENKKILKDILQQHDLEVNIPAYGNMYMNATYEYSLIHFVLNYYTVKEVEDDCAGISSDEVLNEIVDELNTIVYCMINNEDKPFTTEELCEKIRGIRDRLTKQMTVLTAYTDALQLYEYILNRVEFGITGAEYEVDAGSFAARVFQYLFADADKMVINSKIQLVTAQLPIRMTKNRFFDYLTDTLNIYIGSECKSVDDFVDMLMSTALLTKPDGYGDQYKSIADLINVLDYTDYKTLEIDQFRMLMEQFGATTDYLTRLVSDYLLVAEMVNDLFAIVLAKDYQHCEAKSVSVCLDMICGIHDAYTSGGDIPESVDEGFTVIEGIQEELGQDIMQCESILQEVIESNHDLIDYSMMTSIFANLTCISKLLSSSIFVDLEESQQSDEIADSDYITKKRDALVAELSVFFGEHTRDMNRAVMASMFSSMPVLFNSQDEIKQYIDYSLEHCNNDSELKACAKILDDLMLED